jgi:ankyrin repeat protein
MFAVDNNKLNIVKFLVEHGAKIDETRDISGDTILDLARYKPEIKKYLLSVSNLNEELKILKGPSDEETDKVFNEFTDPDEALMWSIDNDLGDYIQKAIDKGADIDVKSKNEWLLYAVIEGKLNVLKYFVKLGADINYVNEERLTPLIEAVIHLKFNIVKYLVDNGANVEYRGRNNFSALDRAIAREFIEGVKYLLEHHDYSKKDLTRAYNVAKSCIYNATSYDMINLLKEKLNQT